ncbi:MAG: F0F1 ATP synthase subunit B [Chloroflexota bacterium]
MAILALAQGLTEQVGAFAAVSEEGAGLTINFFWIIVSSLNFIVFFYLVYRLVLVPVGRTLESRRERIEQGLQDADAARRDREAATDQRQGIIAEARREASDIVARGQHVSDEAREKGVADTQLEIDRMRERAVADIDGERQRALADVRAQVAELALPAAGKVVG